MWQRRVWKDEWKTTDEYRLLRRHKRFMDRVPEGRPRGDAEQKDDLHDDDPETLKNDETWQ